MIKYFFLVLVFLSVASRNSTEVGRRLLQKATNGTDQSTHNTTEFDSVLGSRRNLGSYSYSQHRLRDRRGGDISCGRYGSHQSIKSACNSHRNCAGYTIRMGRPWCLKTRYSHNMKYAYAHVYYEKIQTSSESYPCSEGSSNQCETCIPQAERRFHNHCMSCNSGYYLQEGKCLAYTCSTGSNDKCESCMPQVQRRFDNDCMSCNSGYYLQGGKCLAYPCSEGYSNQCETCMPQAERRFDNNCMSCNSGYYLENGKCLAYTCSEGSNDKCEGCMPQDDRRFDNHCISCNSGYYLENGKCLAYTCSEGSNDQCYRCKPQSHRRFDNDCSSCNSGYYLTEDGKCLAYTCSEGSNDKCERCMPQEGRRFDNHCISCNSGYYLTEDGKCLAYTCSQDQCKRCKVQHARIRDDDCESCHFGYYLQDGKCLKYPQEGEFCTGYLELPCADDLICQDPNKKGLNVNSCAPNYCKCVRRKRKNKEYPKEGEFCTGYLELPCADGLICQDPKKKGLNVNSCVPNYCTCVRRKEVVNFMEDGIFTG